MIKISAKVNDDRPPVFRIPKDTNLQGLTETLHKIFTMSPRSYHLWYNFFGHYVPLRIEKQLLTYFLAYHVYRMPHIELLLREKDGAPPPLFDLEDIDDLKDIRFRGFIFLLLRDLGGGALRWFEFSFSSHMMLLQLQQQQPSSFLVEFHHHHHQTRSLVHYVNIHVADSRDKTQTQILVGGAKNLIDENLYL
nr:hypothetical protein [Tanacetum cinerariifolium]